MYLENTQERIKELEYHIQALRGKLGQEEKTKIKMMYDLKELVPIWAEYLKTNKDGSTEI